MDMKKGKNILMINGIVNGHFTGSVEIIQELVSLGHNVTCYIIEPFAERVKNIGAKIKILELEKSDIPKPQNLSKLDIIAYNFARAIDAIFTLFLKEKIKYDYLLLDSFFEYKEMNKIFKFPLSNIISICTSFCFIDVEIGFVEERKNALKPVNDKYNINLQDFITQFYENKETNNKFMLTSRLFHLRGEKVDNSYLFIGPSIEIKTIDNFNFKKDSNKKLIYISLGTIFNQNFSFYSLCIESFRNSDKYQILMSIGEGNDIKLLGEIPNNFSVFNFVPQFQILKETDYFITHGGLNSTQEAFLNGIPLIIFPQVGDQFDIAKIVEQLGAGIVLNQNGLNAETIRNAVETIDSNLEKYKIGVEKIQESFKEARNNRKEIFKKIFI